MAIKIIMPSRSTSLSRLFARGTGDRGLCGAVASISWAGPVSRAGPVRHSRSERLIGRVVPKKDAIKCDDRAKNDSNANAVNHRDCNQCLCGIHRLRHFGRTKLHFFLENVPSVCCHHIAPRLCIRHPPNGGMGHVSIEGIINNLGPVRRFVNLRQTFVRRCFSWPAAPQASPPPVPRWPWE